MSFIGPRGYKICFRQMISDGQRDGVITRRHLHSFVSNYMYITLLHVKIFDKIQSEKSVYVHTNMSVTL